MFSITNFDEDPEYTKLLETMFESSSNPLKNRADAVDPLSDENLSKRMLFNDDNDDLFFEEEVRSRLDFGHSCRPRKLI